MKLFLFSILTFLLPDSFLSLLQNGDLIFQESCERGVGEAIKEVTQSVDSSYHFTHVGMVYINGNDSIFVIEATMPRVKVTPINEYLYPTDKECYPISVLGRLKEPYQALISQAINEGLKLVGKEYDYGYVLGNDKYYCSELIYDMLLKANEEKPVFDLNIMTFKSQKNDIYSQGWIDYFEKHGLAIPEGQLGINPGAMSQSSVLDIIFKFD